MDASLATSVELVNLLGDPTRVRLLALLSREELTVAELVAVTELPQSRVSTHLGKLREVGLLRDRKAGASTYYALNAEGMPPLASKLWESLSAGVKDSVVDTDRRRAEELRRKKGRGWPDFAAGEMERHYSPGRTWEATARGLLGFLSLGDVLDVGCGDGAIAQLVAPHARMLTGLDRSEAVLQAAEQRLRTLKNVKLVRGEMEQLPFAEQTFDGVMLFNVLTHASAPEVALVEAARVLRCGGRLSLVTLAEHGHAELTEAYGHTHPGFSTRKLTRWLKRAGFEVEQCAVTSRERQKPHFEVITAFANRPAAGGA